MKRLDWDEEKNKTLEKERDITFEEIKVSIDSRGFLDLFDHPNQKRYPGQKIMVVEVNMYAYLIPFVEDREKIFLKTVIPSRKATRKYLKK